MNGHSLKLHFYSLKDHKWSIIVWIVINIFAIFSINCKDYVLKFWHKSEMFLHVQTSKVDFPFFSNVLFFLPNVHHSFWKLERILTLMIRRAKGLELIKKNYNQFEHIWFRSAFDFENYGFWKCDFNKSCSYLCDRRHECIIYMI